MEIITLTKEQIYLMHKKAIEIFGGEPGMDENTDGKIESILAQQYGSFGYDKYPSICDKAAMLLYFFVKDHCFKDGNKRVALYATLTFLKLNGCEPTFNNKEAQQTVYAAAEDNSKNLQIDIYIENLSDWIFKHVEKTFD